MKSLSDTILENSSITNLKPIFFFNIMDFFETVTDQEEQKYLTATYKKVDNNYFIYFFHKQKQIGYLKLQQASRL